MDRLRALPVLILACLALLGCGKGDSVTVVASFPCDDLEGVLDRDDGLDLDSEVFIEGTASVHIQTKDRRNVRLFEIEDPGIESVLVSCSAHLKSMSLWGRAFLEVWFHFPDGRALVRRGYSSGVIRSQDWTRTEVTYRLEEGPPPSRILLVVALEGGGNVWVDDVRVSTQELP